MADHESPSWLAVLSLINGRYEILELEPGRALAEVGTGDVSLARAEGPFRDRGEAEAAVSRLNEALSVMSD